MKENKFRYWDKQEKRMYYFNLEDIWDNGYHDGNWDLENNNVMQYIGLKDKKRTEEYPEGKEIYEGDILSIPSSDIEVVIPELNQGPEVEYNQLCEVVFRDGAFQVKTKADSYFENRWYLLPEIEHDILGKNGTEVIGNIYENEELLKKEK